MADRNWKTIAADLKSHHIRLSEHQQNQIDTYVDLLLRWNRKINLTAARSSEEVYKRHILDCLMLQTLPIPQGFTRVLDAGSGAGLPGLLLAVMHPELQITSADTVSKKITFQQEAARVMGLDNHQAIKLNVHQLAKSLNPAERFDILTARAFTALDALLQLGSALLVPGGQLWAMKGKRFFEEQSRVAPDLLASYAPNPFIQTYQFAARSDSPSPAGDKDDEASQGVIAVFRLKP